MPPLFDAAAFANRPASLFVHHARTLPHRCGCGAAGRCSAHGPRGCSRVAARLQLVSVHPEDTARQRADCHVMKTCMDYDRVERALMGTAPEAGARVTTLFFCVIADNFETRARAIYTQERTLSTLARHLIRGEMGGAQPAPARGVCVCARAREYVCVCEVFPCQIDKASITRVSVRRLK